MLSLFIATFSLIGLMVFSMFFILKRTALRLNRQAENYFVHKLRVYEQMIKEKEGTNQNHNEIKEEKEVTTATVPRETVTSDLTIPEYRNEQFLDDLKKVQETFVVDSRKIVSEFVKNHTTSQVSKDYNILKSIREKLSQDVIYEMLTLSKKQQFSLILDALDSKQLAWINKYMHNKKDFDILKFVDDIDYYIRKMDPTIIVKTGNKDDNFDNIDSNIKTIYEDKIHLGVIIIYQDKMYDYSI